MTAFEQRTPDWLSVGDALARVLSRATPLEPEQVSPKESLGRALAQGVLARAPLPPWDNAAMDGYAVRGQDVQGASRKSPISLEVVGETRAGEVAGRALVRGEAIRIMTGAPIPPGADTVIRVEDTDAEESPGRVVVFSDADLGRHIRPGGQDMRGGEEVLTPGTTMGPGQLGLLFATGARTVRVHRKPRVAILSNGDELVPPEEFRRVLSGKGIPETNGPTLEAAVSLAGGIPLPLGIAGDDPTEILEKVEQGRAQGMDILLTSGGASLGEKDLFKRVLVEAGLSLDFWRVKMRPGTPFSFGFLDRDNDRPIAVFGLPGNPASSFVTFQVFCRPFLLRTGGHRRIHRPVLEGIAGETLNSPSHLTHFFRAILKGDPARPEVFLTGPQTSGLIRSQGLARALAIVPEGTSTLEAGEAVRVMLLDDFGLGGEDVAFLPS